MQKQTLTLLAALFVSLGAFTSDAKAWIIDLGQPGTTYVGMVDGYPAAVLQNASGACIVKSLQGVPSGLSEATWLDGTAGSDVIYIVNATYNFCGKTVSPLLLNGYQFTVRAYGGNDTVINLGRPGLMYLFGGAGNDWLWNAAPGTGGVVGESDSDEIWSASGLILLGDNVWGSVGGDDRFCIPAGQQAKEAHGQQGFNRLCGAAEYFTNMNITACTCF